MDKPLPAMKHPLRTALQRGACAIGLTLIAIVVSPSSQAADIYRYRDPFGIWRSMKVPTGYAKYYQRAQAKLAGRSGIRVCLACDRAGSGAMAFSDVTANMARIDRLEASGLEVGHGPLIALAAKDSGVDRALLTAVIAIESGFRSDARSPKGALGLMQLMPATAAPLLGVDDVATALVDPATNVRVGSRHLRRLIDQYPGRLDLALAAYNAGEGAVRKYDNVPPYAETQQYVRDVTALYARYKKP